MNYYERLFETDWDTLSPERAAEHAYAIGVAERLGEDNHRHLVRLIDAMETGYASSLVELAYREGKTDAANRGGRTEVGTIWADLVEEPEAATHTEDRRNSLPAALDIVATIQRRDLDSRKAIGIPEFLKR